MDNKLKKVVSAIVKDFLKKNKRNPKDDKELALFVQSQGGDKYIKRKTQEVLGGQTQEQELTPEQKLKAAHGAKLNYLKSLKHKCAEDEELYYYKKGGSVGCGCKKKEDGGEIQKAGLGTIVRTAGNAAVAAFRANKNKKKAEEAKKKVEEEKKKNTHGSNSIVVGKDIQRGSGNDTSEQEKKDKSAKDYYKGVSYHTIMADKCGAKAVKKFKMHRLGGSLNGIPFYQKGTPEGGIEFQENLEPPTYGVLGELGRNLEQGSEQFGKIIGSPATLILLTGLGSGIAGMAGPTVRILKDAKTALGSKSGFRNAIRKISRNLNARKGNPEFQWVRTSGDIKKGGFTDRAFNGMGNSAQRTVSRATRSEGSGYSAQPILNNNPVYQQARRTPESVAGRRLNHARATEQGYTSSNRVFLRNKLIDKARDWRNWIFE